MAVVHKDNDMKKTKWMWAATVTYQHLGENGKILGPILEKTRLYDMTFKSNGKAVQLNKTRVIRDLVPPGHTTLTLSIRKRLQVI